MLNKLKNRFCRKTARPFKLLQIEPTLLCSLDCVMCPWTELRLQGGHMSRDTFANLQPYLHLAEEIDFTGGGEPLKNPILPGMVRAAKEAGCQVGFSTNGKLLTQSASEELISLGLDWISFSVDAATAGLYERIRQGADFNTVIENITRLHKLKAKLGVDKPEMMMVFVMMLGEVQNFHQLPDYIRLAHQLGVKQVIAKNLDVIIKEGDDQRRLFSHDAAPVSEVETAISKAQQQARQLGVSLRVYALRPQELAICEHNPLQSVFVNWEGYVSPCITLSYAETRVFAGKRIHVPCQRFGNLNHEPIDHIWRQPAYLEFRGCFATRKNQEQQAMVDALLSRSAVDSLTLQPAPEGCQTCYYLYGV